MLLQNIPYNIVIIKKDQQEEEKKKACCHRMSSSPREINACKDIIISLHSAEEKQKILKDFVLFFS